MTTNWTVKLTQGKRELDLNAGRYQPALGFVPPPVSITPLIAYGTSANRYSGGRKVSERAANRQWRLPIKAKGTTDAEVARAGADLASFLALAGADPVNPLHLEVRANSDTPEPLWGNYGTNFKYEIVHASPPSIDPSYSRGDRREIRAVYTSDLMLKPFSVGKAQRVASALGTVIEDVAGWKDGLSHGLIIAEGAGNDDNFFTDPVFGNGTFGSIWANGANLTDTQNTDERFVLYGQYSAKLVANGSTATNRAYTESLTLAASDHILSAHIKLPSGGAVSSTQVQIFYNGAAQTTTYDAIGDDGWYRIYATVTGTGAGAAAGVTVADGYTVYMDGAQAKASSYLTPFVYGDMLGVAWSGTAHASASDATAGRVRIACTDSMNNGEGTFRVIWKADKSVGSFGANAYLFRTTTLGLEGLFNNPFTDWRFNDGTNVAEGATLTFVKGDIVVFHFVYSPSGGLVIYQNGASYATNATYTNTALPTDIYIGTNESAASHINGTFLDFATWDTALTSTQVSNDYTNIVQLTTDKQRVGTIPWLWTKDGDDIVDNFEDATHDTFAVMGGIPGSAPAETQFDIATPSMGTTKDLYLSLLDIEPISMIDVATYLYDTGGTDSVTSAGWSALDLIAHTNIRDIFYDRAFLRMATLTDAGTGLIIRNQYFPGSSTSAAVAYLTESRAKAADATARMFKTPMIYVRPVVEPLAATTKSSGSVFGASRTGTTGNVVRGSSRIMFSPLFYVQALVSVTSTPRVTIKGAKAAWSESNIHGHDGIFIGDPIELRPNKYNLIISYVGQEGQAYTSTDTITYSNVTVWPRYSLL